MYRGEKEIIDCLLEYHHQSKKSELTLTELSSRINHRGHEEFPIDTIRRALEALKSKGYIAVRESPGIFGTQVTDHFRSYASRDFPEIALAKKAMKGVAIASLSPEERTDALPYARYKQLVSVENGILKTIVPAAALDQTQKILRSALVDALDSRTITDKKLEGELVKRRFIIPTQEGKTWTIALLKFIKNQDDFKEEFDVSVKTASAPLGKSHVITQLRNKIATIFTSMGFEEMEGSMVESAFWNFDALFQPQDHPARELADTFYLDGTEKLPTGGVVDRVRDAHEKGWKYSWQDSAAMRKVLRTHTTAVSARTLASHYGKDIEKKYFAIGRVFRNEATDYKHLAEFHQVEGIIASKNANFGQLLGTLKTFYARLGFDQIRFRPSFFPYTEPSLEIEVYFKPKKQWMELGGAGIFRPEVCKALWGNYPVLAWGLSLERPLMMLLDLDDIRTFYKNDRSFLEAARV